MRSPMHPILITLHLLGRTLPIHTFGVLMKNKVEKGEQGEDTIPLFPHKLCFTIAPHASTAPAIDLKGVTR